MLGNQLRQFHLVGTSHFLQFLTIFEELKCRHGLNSTLARNFIGIIDIYLYKLDIRILFGQLFKDGTNEFAWTAPEKKETERSMIREAYSVSKHWKFS